MDLHGTAFYFGLSRYPLQLGDARLATSVHESYSIDDTKLEACKAQS